MGPAVTDQFLAVDDVRHFGLNHTPVSVLSSSSARACRTRRHRVRSVEVGGNDYYIMPLIDSDDAIESLQDFAPVISTPMV